MPRKSKRELFGFGAGAAIEQRRNRYTPGDRVQESGPILRQRRKTRGISEPDQNLEGYIVRTV